MITNQEADEKVTAGWIKTWLMFEVLAVTKEASKKALESLMNRLENDDRVKMYKRDFGDFIRVEKPIENIDEGFSLTCEVEVVSKKLDYLFQIVTEYGPSAIELLAPSKLQMDSGEIQNILNSLASILHRFAAAGVGGMVFIREKGE